MNPSSFEQANRVLGPPAGLTESEVGSLNVFCGVIEGRNVTISRFRPCRAEVVALAEGASVWLHVLGKTMPPVELLCADPFAPVVSSFVSTQDGAPVEAGMTEVMAEKATALDAICDMVCPQNETATPEEVMRAVARLVGEYKKAVGGA